MQEHDSGLCIEHRLLFMPSANVTVALYFTVLFLVYILCSYCSNYKS